MGGFVVRLLDLFCGAGGAAVGYSRAGFDVIVGVDIVPQPNYPFDFIQGDALNPPVNLEDFDLIHASPVCKAFTKTGWSYHFGYHQNHDDLLTPVRELLETSSTSWVIENVPGAPMRVDVLLCGSQFRLGVRRHRWFETSWEHFGLMEACNHSRRVVSPHGRPNAAKGNRQQWAEAMGIDWMPRAEELAEAIPPAYTEFIGEQFINQLETVSV